MSRIRATTTTTLLLLQTRTRTRTTHLAIRFNSTATATAGPTASYDAQVKSGLIKNDEHQRSIVKILQSLHSQLSHYTPPPLPPPLTAPSSKNNKKKKKRDHNFWGNTLAKFLGDDLYQPPPPPSQVPTIPQDAPKGLYLYGSVGCGKSFLMDLFYNSLPLDEDDGLKKRRVHFHAFMMDVHKRGHELKKLLDERGEKEADWIVHAARDLASEARVLCFDEFQVTDIADAMILRRLMESLMGYGVVAVMTSNRAPDELYKNGIQREQFIPCIELIKKQFEVTCLDSDIDYRKQPRALSKVYFHPLSPENKSEISKIFDALTSSSPEDDPVITNRKLHVWGRPLVVPESTSKVARFTFEELCGHALSAADYLEITKNFETVVLEDVPQLGLDSKDKARRFILFIDAAYEVKTKLFILSEPPITQVFSDASPSGPNPDGSISDHQRAVMDELGLSADKVGASSIFTGEEEVFAFARAVSRLNEMSSVQWAQSSKAA
ncbi:AFG1-like ATPase [Meredithblackwellia eburnea MCA 4105]